MRGRRTDRVIANVDRRTKNSADPPTEYDTEVGELFKGVKKSVFRLSAAPMYPRRHHHNTVCRGIEEGMLITVRSIGSFWCDAVLEVDGSLPLFISERFYLTV